MLPPTTSPSTMGTWPDTYSQPSASTARAKGRCCPPVPLPPSTPCRLMLIPRSLQPKLLNSTESRWSYHEGEIGRHDSPLLHPRYTREHRLPTLPRCPRTGEWDRRRSPCR